MKNDDTDSNEPELAALQWYEQLQTMDVDETTFEAHRRWLKTPANAEAYRKVAGIFTLVHTLADSPELALLSEETNKRIADQRREGCARPIPETPTEPNPTEPK